MFCFPCLISMALCYLMSWHCSWLLLLKHRHVIEISFVLWFSSHTWNCRTHKRGKYAPFLWVIIGKEKQNCCIYLRKKNANTKIWAPCWLALVIGVLQFMSEDLENHYWFGSLLTYYQQVLLMLLLAVMSSLWLERFPRRTWKMNAWTRAKSSIKNLPFLPTLIYFRGTFGSFSDRSCCISALSRRCDYWLGNHFGLPGLPLPYGRMHTLYFRTGSCWDGSWINSWFC